MAAVRRSTGDRAFSIPLPAIVVPVVIILGLAAFWLYQSRSQGKGTQGPALTKDAADYVSHLKLSDVEMKASESYLKQAILDIEGKIGNNGDRVVKLVEINCVFRDAYGQMVLRERVSIVGRRTGSLNPGDTKSFRLAFDNVPGSWNQAMPDLVIAQILFA